MIDDLMDDAGIALRCSGVMMQQTDGVQRYEAYQRELEDPDPRVYFPAMSALGHAFTDQAAHLADRQGSPGANSYRCCTKALGNATDHAACSPV